jgi:hypothetical protein
MLSGMVLGEKLFEESDNITGVKVTRVHPIEQPCSSSVFISND